MRIINIPKNDYGSYESVIKTEAAINRLFEELLSLPYRFFNLKIEKQAALNYIRLSDFEKIEDINIYPSYDNEIGQTKSAYRWSEGDYWATLSFEERWRFGIWPSDSRYSMPDKILLKDLTTFHFSFKPDFALELVVDKKMNTLQINALGPKMDDIYAFFESVFQ